MGSGFRCFLTYESDILFSLRFMIDCDIVGGQWVTIPEGTYRSIPPSEKLSLCQCEVHAHYSRLISHKPDGEWF